jgi:carbonic anhydrase
VIQDAWAREQRVQLHGWCYGLKDGLIHNLHISLNGNQGMESLYRAAVEGVIAARR